jgi:hypothetical protein
MAKLGRPRRIIEVVPDAPTPSAPAPAAPPVTEPTPAGR